MVWGYNALIYDHEAIPNPPKSWSVLWDPAYKGKIAIWDDVSFVTDVGRMLGFDGDDPATVFHMTDPQLAQVPVVLVTNAKPHERPTIGVNDVVRKPIDIDEVLAKLARWISPQAQAAQPAGPAEAATLDWHSLPGVDGPAALERLRGNEKILRRTLLRFFQAHEDFAGKFMAAWVAPDPATARRLAHDLHSLAGLLCMAVRPTRSHVPRCKVGSRYGNYGALQFEGLSITRTGYR
jgi:hypothetical protein